ncbi:ROK family protein [Propionibacteriaceae bacterium Y1685]
MKTSPVSGPAPASGHSSAGQLLQLFADRPLTRRQVQMLSGLSRSTVTARIDALLDAGYLTTGATSAGAGRGRPAADLELNASAMTALAVDLGVTHGRLAVADGEGTIHAEHVLESDIAAGPDAVLDRVSTTLEKMLADTGRAQRSLAGLGIGVPGPVHWESGDVARSLTMPGWDHFPLAARLAERFGVPVLAENDANLLGFGEVRAGWPESHIAVFVKIGTGIGAAIVVDGHVLRGHTAAEGDIGHVKVPGIEGPCTCGATGCLAAGASGRAMAAALSGGGRTVQASRDVVELVRAGDPEAVRVVVQAGRWLGAVLADAVGLLNPDVVIIGGDMAMAHEHLLVGIREAVLARVQPLASAHLNLTNARLGDRAGILGAVEMVRDTHFSTHSVDKALAARQASSG